MKEAAVTTYRHSLREMQFVTGCWVLAFLWTVSFCYLRGYEHAPDSWVMKTGLAEPRNADNYRNVLGFPDWVMYGIIAPWVVCSVVTVVYGTFGMKDDDLGTEGDEHGA